MYCTRLFTDVGKNFLRISFLTFGTHMPMYSYLFENLLFFGVGNKTKQAKDGVYCNVCKHICVEFGFLALVNVFSF